MANMKILKKIKTNKKNDNIVIYDSNMAKKIYNFFRNRFILDIIIGWQKEETNIFPNDNIISKETKKDFEIYFDHILKKNINNLGQKMDAEIKDMLDYILMFDINNKNKDIYKDRINTIYEYIISSKLIKNPNTPAFEIFEQPLFYYFVNKSVPDEAKDFFKKPAAIFEKSLIPEYDNYVDKNINAEYEYLLFFNDKSVLIEESMHSSAMSYIHLLCIPKKRIYNCITLENNELINNMKRDVQEYVDTNFTKCLTEFGTRVITFKINSKQKVYNFDLLEKNKIVNVFINSLIKIYEKFNKLNSDYEAKDIYNELLTELNNSILNIKRLDKRLEFYFHIHPFHGIGYLHMHCLYTPLKTKSWNHFIRQFININDLMV